MKKTALALLLAGLAAAPLLTSCSSARKAPPAPAPAATGDGKATAATDDEVDEYAVATVADPIEPVNRGTFWFNHQLYTYVVRPISTVYKRGVPKPVRRGLDNAFENVKFPIRMVNDLLQGQFVRAGQETGKFVVNTVGGVGGIMRVSDRIPALANVPAADTGQTLAKWGLGHGAYIVLPVLGPSSVRDTVGLAGDYALNPISWISFIWGGYAWTIAIPTTNTVRATPAQLEAYDAATKDALDRYLAARTAYIQYREEVAKR